MKPFNSTGLLFHWESVIVLFGQFELGKLFQNPVASAYVIML